MPLYAFNVMARQAELWRSTILFVVPCCRCWCFFPFLFGLPLHGHKNIPNFCMLHNTAIISFCSHSLFMIFSTPTNFSQHMHIRPIDFRCPFRWISGWILFAVWTTKTVNLAVDTIFIVMDLDGVCEVSGNHVCDRIHRRILLLHRFDGYTGKCVTINHTISISTLLWNVHKPRHIFWKRRKERGSEISEEPIINSRLFQVYISEIASPDIRGFLSAIQKIAGYMGVLISYSLGAYLDWRQLAMLISLAPLLLFITVINIPETPSFLVLNGRDDEAYR